MRGRFAPILGAIAVGVAAVGLTAGGGQSASAHVTTLDSSCPNGHACPWTQSNYNGHRYPFGASAGGRGWFSTSIYGYSAKNRFGDRKVLLKYSPQHYVVCMHPGDNLSDVNGVFQMRITAPGGGCG